MATDGDGATHPGARYLQVAEAIRREIDALGTNSLLPTEHQLAKRFAVSRVTVRGALDLLERGGLVSRRRGRGTIVNPPKVTRVFHPLLTIEDDFRRQGLVAEAKVLRYEAAFEPPSSVRERLKLSSRDRVGFLLLLRIVDDLVIALDRRYFSTDLARRFRPELVGQRPVARVLNELAGAVRTVADFDLEIIPASRETAAVLGVTPGVLVVETNSTEHGEEGSPLHVTTISYRVDRVRFRIASSYAELPGTESGAVEGREAAAGRSEPSHAAVT
jgi:GntR family transcriptional regulator